MSSIDGLQHGLGAIKSGGVRGTDARDRVRTSNRKARFTRRGFFLVRIHLYQDRSFSGHLCPCGNRDFCGGPVYGLSSGSSEGLDLDGSGGRPSSSGGGSIRDVRKTGIKDVRKVSGRVLRLCNSPIKVFNAALCLSNHVFFRLQILQYFNNHPEDPS